MESSSRRVFEASKAPARLVPPRTSSTDAGLSNDIPHSFRTARDSLQSRLDGVDRIAAHRKFALYGRQHAHVDHLSGTQHDSSIVLQSTVLLQDDGRLTARLDHVMYVLDGLFDPIKTQRARVAQTRSLLDLIQLLQEPQVVEAMALSRQGHTILMQLKELVLLKLDQLDSQETSFNLALALLLYFLSCSAVAEEIFNDFAVLDAILGALKQEVALEGAKHEKNDENFMPVSTQKEDKVAKKCLKRKHRVKETRKAAEEAGKAATEGIATRISPLTSSTTQIVQETCWIQLDTLLRGYEEFYVGEELQISGVSVLCSTLSNLLQVNGSMAQKSSSNRFLPYQVKGNGASDRDPDTMFQRLQARKWQLVMNGGIDVLATSLTERLCRLKVSLSITETESIAVESCRLLHHVSKLLNVFDHVAFLNVKVQHFISKKRAFFEMLLNLIKLLSDLSWDKKETKTRWEVTGTVFLAAVRVLINLTHRNVEAARHMFELGGMQVLAASFARLCQSLATWKQTALLSLSLADKFEFDACLLLLSLMVNCIEFSDDNRDALTKASVQKANGFCELLVQFFLSKVQSYKHLIEVTEAQDENGTHWTQNDGDSWNLNDVILGGCTALLLGYLMKGSVANRAVILKSLPDSSPRLLLRSLSVFVALHSQIGALTPEIVDSVLKVEKVLTSCCHGGLSGSNDEDDDDDVIKLEELNSVRTTKGAIKEFNSSLVDGIVGSGERKASIRRQRSLKNVCSRLEDDLEEEKPSHASIPEKVANIKTSRGNTRKLGGGGQTQGSFTRKPQEVEIPLLRNPLPTDSSSIPGVPELLKRTRKLVEEVDTKFAVTVKRSLDEKQALENRPNETNDDNALSSSSVVLTMNVTCRDTGSNELDLAQDDEQEDPSAVFKSPEEQFGLNKGSATHKKELQWTVKGGIKRVAKYKASSLEEEAASSAPSTPIRLQKRKVVLETPTKTQRSPHFYLESPSLNLTPTKTTPLTSLRVKKASPFLQKETQSPLSAPGHRRKTKAARICPSDPSGSIFDFTD